MTDSIKRAIERLLDEPGDLTTGQAGSERLRSRLTATLSEGLASPSSEAASHDLAAQAAFIDGRLTGAERDKFVADLAQQPGLRADLESAAALVRSTSDSQLQVPKHLLARAGAQFAPAPPPQVESRWDPAAFFAVFFPRRRLAFAAVAAVALMLAVPVGLMIRGQSGGGSQPELSGVEEPVKEAPQPKDKACDDKSKEDKAKDAAKADKAKAAPRDAASSASKKDDPCDSSTPDLNGAKK